MERARKRSSMARGLTVTALIFLITIAALVFGASQVNQKSDAEQAATLEDTVRRAAILYYAVEGRYPADVTELTADYGLRYNQERFIVHIDGFASNLLPDIRVLTVGGDGNE